MKVHLQQALLWASTTFMVLSAASCQMAPTQFVDGSSSETVIGMILDSSGRAAAHVAVTMLPVSFDPVRDTVPGHARTTTDEDGRFHYSYFPHQRGEYTITAHDQVSGSRVSIFGVNLTSDSIVVPHGTLRRTGALQVKVPELILSKGGYLFIPGTTMRSLVAGCRDVAFFDSVPAMTIPAINGSFADGSGQIQRVMEDVTVLPGDTFFVAPGLSWTIYNTSNSALGSDTVYEIAFSLDGAWWLGTLRGGLSIVRNNDWRTLMPDNSLVPSLTILSMAVHADTILMGTSNGIAWWNQGEWRKYTTDNSGLADQTCFDIAVDALDRRWIATWKGITVWYDTVWTTYNTENSGLVDNHVYALKVDRRNNLWIGTYGSGVMRFNEQQWELWDRANSGLVSDMVNCLAIDSTQSIWAGTDNGLSVLQGGIWKTMLDNLAIYSLVVADNGSVWVGSGDGLFCLRGSQIDRFRTTIAGERLDEVWALNIHPDGSIWAGTAHGVFRLAFE